MNIYKYHENLKKKTQIINFLNWKIYFFRNPNYFFLLGSVGDSVLILSWSMNDAALFGVKLIAIIIDGVLFLVSVIVGWCVKYLAVAGLDSENEFLFDAIPLLDSPTKTWSLAFEALEWQN